MKKKGNKRLLGFMSMPIKLHKLQGKLYFKDLSLFRDLILLCMSTLTTSLLAKERESTKTTEVMKSMHSVSSKYITISLIMKIR